MDRTSKPIQKEVETNLREDLDVLDKEVARANSDIDQLLAKLEPLMNSTNTSGNWEREPAPKSTKIQQHVSYITSEVTKLQDKISYMLTFVNI